MATGRVGVELEVNEPLLTTPFLSIAPAGGVPIALPLEASDETHYQGSFEITDTTPSGTAYAVFSARDEVGNRGDEILSGASLVIDTAGPEAIRLTLAPATPIPTDQADPTRVAVEIELDQPVKPGATPVLRYLLSGAGRAETLVDAIVPLSDTVWRGSFALPEDAGLAGAENLQFLLQAVDDLDNPGSRIQAPNLFQVYQGDLPPLAIPLALGARALAGGQVSLSWGPVDDAAAYELYRQAPGESGLSAYRRVNDVAFLDDTALDGEHRYAVASVRRANGVEAVSGQSAPVSVFADASEPGAPRDLTLALVGAGIRALWQAPEGLDESVGYNLYRASGTLLTDVGDLTPVQAHIVADAQGQLGFIDTRPDENEAVYAVTAVDGAGNESAPSESAYLNVDLLPVASLTVIQQDLEWPEIRWSHNGSNIAGYNLYVDDRSEPLNFGLVLEEAYSDNTYVGGARRYRVQATDTFGATSIARSVTLAEIEAELSAQSRLRRGIMNRLDYRVENTGTTALSGIRLEIGLEGAGYASEPFDLAAGAEHTVSVIVGGRQGLPDLVNLEQRVQIIAETGEKAEVIRNRPITLGEDTLLLRVETGELIRDTEGQVRFVLENTSAVETEILLAHKGNKASDEVRFILQDDDGNLLAVSAVQQSTGAGVVTLADGRSVARIVPGGRFTADWTVIKPPAGAPGRVELRLEIDKFRYHSGRADGIAIGGMRSRVPVSLVDTQYLATVDSVTPASSLGDEPILIGGQAIDRTSGQPSGGIPVKLIVSVDGFERVAERASPASSPSPPSIPTCLRGRASGSSPSSGSPCRPASWTIPCRATMRRPCKR
jgi:hypothetical protein